MKHLILILSLIIPLSALAADGDEISPREKFRKIYLMCDSDTADATCSTIEIPAEVSGARVSVDNEAGCTAYTVTVSDKATSGGSVWHTLGTLSFGGTTSVSINTNTTHKYIRSVISSEADCTDLDVVIEFFPMKN